MGGRGDFSMRKDEEVAMKIIPPFVFFMGIALYLGKIGHDIVSAVFAILAYLSMVVVTVLAEEPAKRRIALKSWLITTGFIIGMVNTLFMVKYIDVLVDPKKKLFAIIWALISVLMMVVAHGQISVVFEKVFYKDEEVATT